MMSSTAGALGYDARNMPPRERDPEAARQFGDALRTARVLAHLSRAQLGEATGLKAGYIGRLERGEREATVGVLLRLGRALGTTPAHLLDAMEERER